MRQQIGKRQRWKILARDGFACVYCGLGASQTELHVDHVLAIANGGTNDDGNLVTACIGCNLGKGTERVPNSLDRAVVVRDHPLLDQTVDEYEVAYKGLLLRMLDSFEGAQERGVQLPVASLGMVFALVRHAAEIWHKTQSDDISKQRFIAMCAAQLEESSQQ